jgi:hypothetical protein
LRIHTFAWKIISSSSFHECVFEKRRLSAIFFSNQHSLYLTPSNIKKVSFLLACQR